MSKIEINIDDYVSEEEKKQLCIDYIKETLRGDGNSHHKERVLSNMAYEASYKLLDDSLTKEDMKTIRTKTKRLIQDKNAYGIFRQKDAWGSEDSAAWLEVKKAVETHKHLIAGLVKQTILERDYKRDLDDCGDYLIESVMEIFKRGITG